jgi:predicted component of type VI protein secretion system
MAQRGRPKKTTEEITQETNEGEILQEQQSMFTEEERIELERILKLVRMDRQDMDSIFNLYKKFINPKLKVYNVGCKCQNNITKLQEKLINFYLSNR